MDLFCRNCLLLCGLQTYCNQIQSQYDKVYKSYFPKVFLHCVKVYVVQLVNSCSMLIQIFLFCEFWSAQITLISLLASCFSTCISNDISYLNDLPHNLHLKSVFRSFSWCSIWTLKFHEYWNFLLHNLHFNSLFCGLFSTSNSTFAFLWIFLTWGGGLWPWKPISYP